MIKTKDLLVTIGFTDVDDKSLISNNKPSLEFDFGNFKLQARELMNKRLANIIQLSGLNTTERTIHEIKIELPLVVESIEEGLAMISYGLGNPFDATNVPDWYYLGLKHKHLLPWIKEMEAFKSRQEVTIEYDYYRIIIRSLLKNAKESDANDLTIISFNGEMLTINCSGNKIFAPALGEAWSENAVLKTQNLSALPKRLRKKAGIIAILKNKITFDNYVFNLLS